MATKKHSKLIITNEYLHIKSPLCERNGTSFAKKKKKRKKEKETKRNKNNLALMERELRF